MLNTTADSDSAPINITEEFFIEPEFGILKTVREDNNKLTSLNLRFEVSLLFRHGMTRDTDVYDRAARCVHHEPGAEGRIS